MDRMWFRDECNKRYVAEDGSIVTDSEMENAGHAVILRNLFRNAKPPKSVSPNINQE